MSLNDLKAYGQRATSDPEVRAAAKAIGLSDMPGHIAYAETLGYTFDQDDMVALAREVRPAGEELTEEELSQVAGGIFFVVAAVIIASVVTSANGTADW